MSEQDGGPAFPNNQENMPDYPIYDGMSLRDYFAGQALAGILANPEVTPFDPHLSAPAYEIADAMLKTRRGKT